MKVKEGTVTSPAGFRAAAVACGLKTSGNLDLGLVLSERPASLAAVFTTILIKSAPVLRDMRILGKGPSRAFFVNSGCANACTGDVGLDDAERMAAAAANATGISSEEVFVASTGKIGLRLDTARIESGARKLAEALSLNGGGDFAMAIMTTDTVPKTAATRVRLKEGTVTIGGCAKGAGMLSPNMATMLAFLTTDADISRSDLQCLLESSADVSFNKITVDAHMSTNDTLAIMANGASGVKVSSEQDLRVFGEALTGLCVHLARELVRDGEGATKLIEIEVEGAGSCGDAELMARKIADSPLVKCAFHGADPNWGRITSAAGAADVDMDPSLLSLDIGSIRVFEAGEPCPFDQDAAREYMKGPEISILIKVGNGPGRCTVWGCDLSSDYVHINADYTT